VKTAGRLDHIEPFYVMECAKAADEIARGPLCDPAQGGRPMIYLNIGEPDFTAAPLVVEAAMRCMAQGRTQYTQATGLPELREDIARWYAQRFGLNIEPGRGGGAAAHHPGAGRSRRRGAAARPELSLQPPLRCRGRRPRRAAAVWPRASLSARRRCGARRVE
jgi:hypothetical protein